MGQMQWQRNNSGNLELYIRDNENSPWKHYRTHPMSKPDGDVKSFSPGWLTYNHLIKQNW